MAKKSKNRKTMLLTVEVSYPHNMSAAVARKEVRSLVNNGVGYHSHVEVGDVKIRSMAVVGRYARMAALR